MGTILHFFIHRVDFQCKGDTLVPPIYSIEMDAATFKDFRHIGVPTCGCGDKSSSEDAVLVIIEHPHSQRLRTVLDTSSSCSAECSLFCCVVKSHFTYIFIFMPNIIKSRLALHVY
ncbi:hypothetical protein K1719_021605 [Acacia pycnantha]|nr:hypothetical protein K1719_021605 [Acacia pycnantha]